ncbi:Zinc finger matrin-type protein 4 [Fukomys damarensis]|uniref:Zinc finger matrin-type protein 4 n=1 Tax=Fukomys damarensis TaxID=885580 RepID=A0A091E1I5_FUKDA|nr:Zinc finger matrin-type protein 4 [Fukomys damarensis]
MLSPYHQKPVMVPPGIESMLLFLEARQGQVGLMKSSDIDQDLFTDSYCKVCSAQLISESQRVAHYESRKHASKVRLYYMLHPRDGGCPAKRLRAEKGSDADMVDKNKCCTLCNMSFTSAVVADSHYQGKIHAKRLKLLLGEKTPLKTTGMCVTAIPGRH